MIMLLEDRENAHSEVNV